MSDNSVVNEIISKGRITVWLIIISALILSLFGTITGDQFLEILKIVGTFWLGNEAGARGLEK